MRSTLTKAPADNNERNRTANARECQVLLAANAAIALCAHGSRRQLELPLTDAFRLTRRCLNGRGRFRSWCRTVGGRFRRAHAGGDLRRAARLDARLVGAATALATIEERSVLALRFLIALFRAAIHAQRIAALAVTLLDHLAAGQRADTLGLWCERLPRFADATDEAYEGNDER